MGGSGSQPAQNDCQGDSCKLSDKPSAPVEKKLKPCCACPETKKIRDACIVEKGEENCGEEIEAHKRCMRKMGFNV
jgi:cytochrome c oxidase assembly protein subunit 17